MIPMNGLPFKHKGNNDGKDGDGDDFLNHF